MATTAPTEGRAWFATGVDETAGHFGVDVASGLSDAEAAQRLSEHGPNALPKEPPPSV